MCMITNSSGLPVNVYKNSPVSSILPFIGKNPPSSQTAILNTFSFLTPRTNLALKQLCGMRS